MRQINNTKQVAEASKHGCKLYYSFRDNAVYTETSGDDMRWYITDLIRENNEEEIVKTVYKMLSY